VTFSRKRAIDFLSLQVTATAEVGLKIRAYLCPDLQEFEGGQPPASERQVYAAHCLPVSTVSTMLHLAAYCPAPG
jgi:hypothetical protein